MYINCSNVTRTKCPIAMYKISKIEISRNFGPLIEHGPHWINFIIFTFISEKKEVITLDAYVKFGANIFHLT
jgi:hypothetical protein